MQAGAPILKDLVLLGGGHAHVAVIKAFGMKPIEGVRVTLISNATDTPYSGMLPGLIAGHYTFEETHIDLGRLSRFAGARFVQDEAIGIDPDQSCLLFSDRPPLAYNLLSIDTGSTPNINAIPGAAEFATPVKPISSFLQRWEKLCARAVQSRDALRIALIGAGAGGVELLLAAQFRLQAIRNEAGISAPVRFDIFSASTDILPAFGESVRRKFIETFRERRINIHADAKVARVDLGALVLENGTIHAADEILLVTEAAAPEWFAHGGLATSENGFIRVNAALQSTSHPNVFAAGDIAAVDNFPRPKAGVFAVRQGPPLTRNLRHALMGQEPAPFKPQKEFLSLISTGDQYAIASRNGLAASGKWVWQWKDWIDRRFMQKFNDLPAMEPGKIRKAVAQLPALKSIEDEAMRCGGCGAKVGADALTFALKDLKPFHRSEVIAGLDAPDDAAIVRAPQGKLLAHTVDSFRAIVEDPYLFGKIAANHALSDIFAMGGEPQTALAIAALPYAAPAIIAEDLRHLMAGALSVLNAAGVTLVGGHTAEAAELSLGFAINGQISEDLVLRKSGLQTGDRIILTKPLGTGALFAADMQYRAKSRWVSAALQSMLQSNGPAARCLIEHGTRTATDVTGFGLAGHLSEMAQASNKCVSIDIAALPLLDGFVETAASGIFSSLQGQNASRAAQFFGDPDKNAPLQYPVLCDPQTSGGLIASLHPYKAQSCIEALRELGYDQAAIIGTVEAGTADGRYLTMVVA